jgi:RNA polymerase sigma factor (sigma-70 family)
MELSMGSALPSEIWEEFVSGDISKYQKLFEGYYDGLYGYGLKICNDSGLVEDCIQELFEFIWVQRNDLNHINSPNVYLFVSLRRKIFAVLKKRDNFNDGNEIFENLNIHFGMEEVIIKREFSLEKKMELHEALNQLTNQQKEVIYLYYYNGMSYSEIEDILSINRQSVHNHMYRGMETLRSVLNKDIMRLVISVLICVLVFL